MALSGGGETGRGDRRVRPPRRGHRSLQGARGPTDPPPGTGPVADRPGGN